MADTRCYKNYTVDGKWSLKDISKGNTVCPGTQEADGFSRCCGSSAICLPNNICQALNVGKGGSGFYVGSCTDRDFKSPACSNFCSALSLPDIVYNQTQDKWHCCGADANGAVQCEDPTKRTSKAPAPTILLENYSASVSTFTASSTSSGTPSSSSTATSGTQSGGLSTGAKAGAGIGGAIGGLLVIALIVFLFRWQRKAKPAQHPYEQQQDGSESYELAKQNAYTATPSHQPTYQTPAKSDVPPVELSPTPARAELPADGPPRVQPPQELPP